MYESRYQYIAIRPRELRGRFLTRKEIENLRTSSQEKTDRFKARVFPNSLSKYRFAIKQLLKITKNITISFYSLEELEDLRRKYSTKRP